MSYPDYKYGTGLSNVGSYQVSGKPFAKGGLTAPASGSTPLKVEFPSVTRWVKIIGHEATSATDLRVGFSEYGVTTGSNYYRVHISNNANHEGGYAVPLELKVTELYFMSDSAVSDIDFDVVAGLTGISVDRINNISPSGSNWSGSIGVG